MPTKTWLRSLFSRPRADARRNAPKPAAVRPSLVVIALEDRTVPSALINNGVVQLGVNDLGNFNVAGAGIPSFSNSTSDVGLRYLPTGNPTLARANYEATAQGAPAEGWGVADVAAGKAGYANRSSGTAGLTQVSFTSTATSAVSVVTVNGTSLRVTQDYHPVALTPYLYENTVTIQNTSTTTAVSDLRYRRSMDWDIEPTSFSEYVTIQGWGVESRLFRTGNDGFASSNPLATAGTIGPVLANTNFTDIGPFDHGAVFDFSLGALAPGATTAFNIYYGGAPTESKALAALTSVNATVYSLGQNSTPTGRTIGDPVTFMFAFGNLRTGGENSPPVANPDTKSATGPLTFPASDLIANDTDPDGDALNIVSVSPTSTAGGTVTLNPATLAVTYTPPAGFSGADTFTYVITDGLATATGTVTVNVTSGNRPPVANPDTASTNDTTPVSGNALANDTDPDGDPLVVTTPGTYAGSYGTLVLGAGGAFTYTPALNAQGTDTFNYTISDGRGGTASSTISVTVADRTAPTVVQLLATYGPGRTVNLLDPALTSRILPWFNITKLAAVFSEGVSVQQGDLNLTGVLGGTYSFSGFAYDAGTSTATWTLTAPLGRDRLRFDLDGNAPAGVTDTHGNYLNGNLTTGTDFVKTILVLPGDFDSSGVVNLSDQVKVRNANDPSFSPLEKQLADVNGDGVIDLNDVALIRSKNNTTLPPAAP